MDESGTRRVTVEEAAQLLGIEKGSVKKRIQRGKLRSEKDATGQVRVYLDRSETVRDQSQRRSETDRDMLYQEMRDRIAYLERQVEEEREARRRADTLLARLMDNMPALEAPSEAPEAPETAAEEAERAEPRPATGGDQEGVQRRSWWRRMFGG